MQVLQKYHYIRIILKLAHIVSACVWLGAVVCIGLMLYLNYISRSSDELLAFSLGMKCMDNYLIGPSVVICFLSGYFICLTANLRLLDCRWVATKWIGTWVAMLFGIFWLAPWLRKLEALCFKQRFIVFTSPTYYHVYWLDCFNLLAQTVLLVYLMFISVKKPCSDFRNCVGCREYDDPEMIPEMDISGPEQTD